MNRSNGPAMTPSLACNAGSWSDQVMARAAQKNNQVERPPSVGTADAATATSTFAEPIIQLPLHQVIVVTPTGFEPMYPA